MKKRGRLRLTAQQMDFTISLCRELNRLGIPVEYGAFIVAIGNWWLGNAEQRIPEDNQRLASCLSQAIMAWIRKARSADDLPGFVILQMKIYAANRPLSCHIRTGGGERALADTIQAWCRKAGRS